MRFIFLSVFAFFINTQVIAQSSKKDFKTDACSKIDSLIKEYQTNIYYEITPQDYAFVDSLVKYCSRKSKRASMYKVLITKQTNIGKTERMDLLYKQYYRNIVPVTNKADSNNLSSYYLFLGNTAIRKNNNNLAVKHLDRGIELASKTKDLGNQKNGYMMLGILFHQISDYRKSNDYIKKAATLDKKNKSFQAYGNMLIGNNLSGLKEYDSAIVYLQKSMVVYEELKDDFSANYSKVMMIDAEFELGKRKMNSKFAQKYPENKLLDFRNELEAEENVYGLLVLHKVMAGYYISIKEYEKAETHAKLAFDQSKGIENNGSIKNATEVIIRSILMQQDTSNFEYLEAYINSSKALFNSENAKSTLELRERYNARENENELLMERNKNLQSRMYMQYGFAGALLLVFGIIFFFRHRAKSKNKQLNKLRKQALQLQMNPHFFFNSLNSINNYIASNNIENAQKYLVKFSKLMRLNLENSQEEFATIGNEIAFLENYLILEQLRNPNFDFELIVEPKLLELKIPTLLIQPLVENSILHGLRELNHRGKLCIIIEQVVNKIKITVADNGWGLEKMSSNKFAEKNHKSYATEILQHRLQFYSKEKTNLIFEQGLEGYDTSGTSVSFFLTIAD